MERKPDLTWNGKRRLFFCFLKRTSCNGFGSQSLPKAPERSARFGRCARSLFLKEASWNGFGSQSFPNVSDRSARFARCARSLAALVHRGELSLIFLVFFNVFYCFRDCQHKY